MKQCLECENNYEEEKQACPKCGCRDYSISMSAEDAFKFLDNQRVAKNKVDEGAILFQIGDKQEARIAFEEAIQQNPLNPIAHSNLGITLCNMGQIAEGIKCLEKALYLDPGIEGVADSLALAKKLINPPKINGKFWVDIAVCIGCESCKEVCPAGAISMIFDKAFVDPDECVECGLCFDECPVVAINMT